MNAFTTLFIANKTVSSNQCIAAGCDPANGRNYTNAQMDAIVEVDLAGNIVWGWGFFDHAIQDLDATKANYVGAGKTIVLAPGTYSCCAAWVSSVRSSSGACSS